MGKTKRTKTWTRSLLAILIAAVLVAGCGKKQAEPETAAETESVDATAAEGAATDATAEDAAAEDAAQAEATAAEETVDVVTDAAIMAYEQQGMTANVHLDAWGDRIMTFRQVTYLDTTGFDDATNEQLNANIAAMAEKMKQYSGCEYHSTQREDGVFVETIVLDLSTKEGLNTLIADGILPVDTEETIDYLSLEQTVANFTQLGYQKVTEDIVVKPATTQE